MHFYQIVPLFFQSLIYLSSSRVSGQSQRDHNDIAVFPQREEHISKYNVNLCKWVDNLSLGQLKKNQSNIPKLENIHNTDTDNLEECFYISTDLYGLSLEDELIQYHSAFATQTLHISAFKTKHFLISLPPLVYNKLIINLFQLGLICDTKSLECIYKGDITTLPSIKITQVNNMNNELTIKASLYLKPKEGNTYFLLIIRTTEKEKVSVILNLSAFGQNCETLNLREDYAYKSDYTENILASETNTEEQDGFGYILLGALVACILLAFCLFGVYKCFKKRRSQPSVTTVTSGSVEPELSQHLITQGRQGQVIRPSLFRKGSKRDRFLVEQL